MEKIVKKLDEEIDDNFYENTIEGVYAELAEKIMRVAIKSLNDELFDKAVLMAKAIRDFGDEFDKLKLEME